MDSGNPLTVRALSLGRHGRNTHFRMCLGIGDLAVAAAVVGLLASRAFGQVVAMFAAVEALEDGDPHGLLAGLVFWLHCCRRWLLGADGGESVGGVCFRFALVLLVLRRGLSR